MRFASRQRLYRGQRALCVKQKSVEIAHDVPVFATDVDVFAAASNVVRHRLVGIQRGTKLIEVADFQIGPEFHRAPVRHQLTQQKLQQGAFSNPIVADNSNPVATHYLDGEIFYHRSIIKPVSEMFCFDNLAPGCLRLVYEHSRLCALVNPCGTRAPKCHQCAHSPFIASSPSFDPLTDPCLLLGQFLVEQCILVGLIGEKFLFASEEIFIVTGPTREPPPIQLDYPGRQSLEKAAIVSNEKHTASKTKETVLQPFDRPQIEMVGRLIE